MPLFKATHSRFSAFAGETGRGRCRAQTDRAKSTKIACWGSNSYKEGVMTQDARIRKTAQDRLNAAIAEAEQLSRLVQEWERAGYMVEIRSVTNSLSPSTAMELYDPEDSVH
jgi:hypothetical protein